MAVPVRNLSDLFSNIRESLSWLFPNPTVISMTLPTLEVQNAIESKNFWLAHGGTTVGTYAMLSMEEGESDFNQKAVGDQKKAFSIFQWHDDRVQLMLKGTGINVEDPNTTHLEALEAAYYELQHSENKSWKLIMGAADIVTAVDEAVRHFERSANPVSDDAKRDKYAVYWATYFKAGNSRQKLFSAGYAKPAHKA